MKTHMKNILKTALFVGLLGVTGCTTTSSLQKELAAGGVPKFDGYITPIKIPVLLRYKPTEFRSKSSVVMNIREGSQSEQFYFEVTGKNKTRKLGNLLTHDITSLKFAANGKTTSIPAGVEIRALMDARGNTREVEVIGVDLAGEESKKMTKAIKTIKNIPRLPKTPVRSGDSFGTGDFSSIMEIANAEVAAIFDIFFNHEYTVDGWGVVNGQRLMVTSVEERVTKRIQEGNIQVTLNGYQLWDVETARQIESRLLMVLASKNSSDFSMKMLFHIMNF